MQGTLRQAEPQQGLPDIGALRGIAGDFLGALERRARITHRLRVRSGGQLDPGRDAQRRRQHGRIATFRENARGCAQ
jgi:hypothetical protein